MKYKKLKYILYWLFYIIIYIINNKIFISYQNIIMNKLQETLNPASTVTESSVLEKKTEETNTQLWNALERKNEEYYTDSLIREIKRLNPKVKIEADYDRWIMYSSVDIDKLVLPEGFYYNQKNGVTNKHRTKNWWYVSVSVKPIEEYNPDYL